ncbi:hypothetical protein CPB86DRAFT_752864 [Serendipita vermifera]|nr:hypothetical protein CPB86DRAFT_752864 [Serendipita vermifera]
MSEATSAPSIKISPEFPTGYGDFEILSSDNVVFSFPRGILVHVSPVFKDMFSFGANSDAEKREPLRLTDNASTIKQLLLFNDPLRDPVKITTDTVSSFLEGAMKYQISRMLSAFEKWALSSDGSLHYSHKKEPVILLSLAERLGLQELGSTVLCQLIKSPKKFILAYSSSISRTTAIQILENRMERTEWLHARFMRLIGIPLSQMEKGIPDGEQRHSIYAYSQFSGRDRTCPACLGSLHGLVTRVVVGLHSEPSWSSIGMESKKLDFKCDKCRSNMWNVVSNGSQWMALQKEIMDLESQKIPLKSLI